MAKGTGNLMFYQRQADYRKRTQEKKARKKRDRIGQHWKIWHINILFSRYIERKVAALKMKIKDCEKELKKLKADK